MNLLKHDHQFTIEIYPHGLLVCSPGGRGGGVPMDALMIASHIADKEAVVDAGVAGALGAVFAIGTKSNMDKWRKQIEKDLAESGCGKELEWIRGCDCGLSSATLFYKLAGRQAVSEACHRFNWLQAPNFTPQDAGDFGRCFRMVDGLGWHQDIVTHHKADGFDPKWKAIIAQWDNLCALYRGGQNAELSKILQGINAQK